MKHRIRKEIKALFLAIVLGLNVVTSFVVHSQCFSSGRNLLPMHVLRSSKASSVDTNKRSQFKRQNDKKIDVERQIVKLGRSGKTDEALALYHKEIQVRPTVKLMNLAIDCCARARTTQLQTALKIFNEGTKEPFNLRPNVFTFGALLSTCARARDASRALKILDIMESKYEVQPNVVVYGSAMSACERSNPVRHAKALELLQRAIDDETITTSTILFNTAMSACARAGNHQQAITLINDMEDKYGVAPDEISYATVMAACERCGQWYDVLHYADLCEETFVLDGVACSSALKACQQLALADRAISYLNKMKHLKDEDVNQRSTQGWKRSGAKKPLRGPDDVAYCLAISACSRAREWRKGIELLKEMKENGLDPSVRAYSAAIGGCAEVGEWQAAIKIFDRMIQQGIRPNVVTYSTVISACAKAISLGSPKDLPFATAMKLFQHMKNDRSIDQNIISYNAAISTCAESLEVELAFELMKELKDSGITPTIVTFGALMTACERVEKTDLMEKVFAMIDDEGINPNEIIYGAAISCCRKAGEWKKSHRLLKEMIRNGLSPNVVLFNTVIRALISGGDIAASLKVVELMESSPGVVSPNRSTYQIIVAALAANKRPAEAEAMLTVMAKKGMKPEVELYTVTVTAYEKINKPRLALKLMEQMRQNGYDFYDIPMLDKIFKRAVKIANTLSPVTDEEQII